MPRRSWWHAIPRRESRSSRSARVSRCPLSRSSRQSSLRLPAHARAWSACWRRRARWRARTSGSCSRTTDPMWNLSFSRVPASPIRSKKGSWHRTRRARSCARYVRPIVEKGADIVVLGCTHYPFIRSMIQEAAGPGVDIIDPAAPVARELRRRLESAGLLNDAAVAGTEQFRTTGTVEIVGPIVRQLWGPTAEVAGLHVVVT